MWDTRSSTEIPPDWTNLNNNSKANLYKIMRELKIVPPEDAPRDLLIRLIKEKLATPHTEPYKSPKTFKKPAKNKKSNENSDDNIVPQVVTPDQEEFNDDDDFGLGIDPMSSDVELPKPIFSEHPSVGKGLERQASLIALEQRAQEPEILVSPALSPSIANRNVHEILSNSIEHAAISNLSLVETEQDSPIIVNREFSPEPDHQPSIFPSHQSIDPPPQQAQRVNLPQVTYVHLEISREPDGKYFSFLIRSLWFAVGFFGILLLFNTLRFRIKNHITKGSLEDKAEKYIIGYYRNCLDHTTPLYIEKIYFYFPKVNMTELQRRGITVTNKIVYKDEKVGMFCRALRSFDINSKTIGLSILLITFLLIFFTSNHVLN